jgi:glycerol-3-phosphate dehydrogenase (NAD(P)+)
MTSITKQRDPANVLIVGYGEMGHAMEYLLAGRHRLTIHDTRPIPGLPAIDIEQEAARADFVLLCVPASPHRDVLNAIAARLQNHCICLSIAKGLDDGGQTPAQIYRQIFDARQRYGLLYGPMISEEIRAGRYAFAELGCTDGATYRSVRELYQGTGLHLRHSTDIAGISWSVILKNVYVLAFGIADELGLGDNVRGFLTVTALAELGDIVARMGGRTNAPLGLAGLGDLITTATSSGSHHHELGRKLARGETRGISGEGIHTLEMVSRHKLFDTAPYPLYRLIEGIVKRPVDAAAMYRDYLRTSGCG